MGALEKKILAEELSRKGVNELQKHTGKLVLDCESTTLSLSDYQLDDSWSIQVHTVAQFYCSSLHSMDISFNHFTDVMAMIFIDYPDMDALEYVNFSSNW